MRVGRGMQCGSNVAIGSTCGYICNNCGFEARWEDSPSLQSVSNEIIVPGMKDNNKTNKSKEVKVSADSGFKSDKKQVMSIKPGWKVQDATE